FSDGADAPDDYLTRAQALFPDDLGFLGQHYAGVRVAGEIIPILGVSVAALLDAADGSGLAITSLRYDVADEAVFTGGLLLPWGRKQAGDATPAAASLTSEFGLWPVAAFLETRIHF
ncbi:MAG: hypothetical protein KJ558_16890, partial [Gammaproteobacteria bacterium]|nr:hypothetical protein [Gammaproteobacteria bacterium]